MTSNLSNSTTRLAGDVAHFGKAYWLPACGWDNGLDDDAWAAILDVTSERAARLVLHELKKACVPGYAAPVTRAGGPSHLTRADRNRFRIWVGSGSYGRGETTILQFLPELIRLNGAKVIAP